VRSLSNNLLKGVIVMPQMYITSGLADDWSQCLSFGFKQKIYYDSKEKLYYGERDAQLFEQWLKEKRGERGEEDPTVARKNSGKSSKNIDSKYDISDIKNLIESTSFKSRRVNVAEDEILSMLKGAKNKSLPGLEKLSIKKLT
jgi:hypothetical protein